MLPLNSHTPSAMNAESDRATNTFPFSGTISSFQKSASPLPAPFCKHRDRDASSLFSRRAMLSSLRHLVTPSPCHLVISLFVLSAVARAGAPSNLEQLDFFEKKIRPV